MVNVVLLSVLALSAQDRPQAAPPAGVEGEAIVLETGTGTLHGTLLMPKEARGRVPVVLLLSGSGPTDRDGNSPALPGKNNSLKLLAEGLAAEGFATVRFDKRGIAASVAAGASEADLRFSMYIDDAAAWVRKLKQDSRFSAVSVAGHSEGSLIGMVAANRAGAAAFVSIAGAGRSIADILAEQLQRVFSAELVNESNRILGELRQGRTVAEVPAQLVAVYRPSVQPFLISLIALDPAAELAKLEMPTLIVQGTTDVQVTMADAERLSTMSPRSQVLRIDGMNHVLKEVREASALAAAQAASYSDPTLPLHSALVPGIAGFLRR